MSYLGDFALGKTFDTKFTTVSTTGAPTTLAGTPVISAYPDNSVTQLTAGITLTVDFDAVTGLHNVRVVATGANGYLTATNYQLVITTGTVGGTSVVGYVVAEFSIEARSAIRPTTADRTLDVSAGGEGGVDWANVGTPGSTVALSATTVATVTTTTTATNVTTVNGLAAGVVTAAAIATGAVDADALAADAVAEIADGVWDEDATGHQTLGTYGQAIGDPVADTNTIYGAVVTGAAGATIAADIVVVQADTDDIQTRLPAALVSGRIDSSVGAMATGVVTATAIAADAIGASELAADAATEIRDAVWAQTLTEATAVPSITGTMKAALEWLFMLGRNKITQTATTQLVRNDADAATVGTSTVSDDATTFIRGKFL